MSASSSKGVRLGRWVVRRHDDPNGCRTCQERGRKCEKARPCKGCRELGIRCIPATQKPANIVIAPNTRLGGRSFYRFVTQVHLLVPQDEFPQAYYYWNQGILQAGQRSETMMDVIHCKTIMNELPSNHLFSTKLPAEALKHYVQSLRKPVKDDILLLLMVTNMYIEIEWLLGHDSNIDAMVRSTYALLFSVTVYLRSWRLNDQLLFAILVQLMHLTCETCVNTDCVPLAHWNFLLNLLLRMSTELGLPVAYRLELQMFDIKYKLQRENLYDPNMGWQIAIWEHNLKEHMRPLKSSQADMTFINSLQARFKKHKLFWHSFLWWSYRNESSGGIVRTMVEQALEQWERMSEDTWVKELSEAPCFNIFVHTGMVRDVVYYNWCVRDKAMEQRWEKVIQGFRPWLAYENELLDYLRTLSGTEFGQRTAKEIESFGPDAPFFLFIWQIYRLTHRICRDYVRAASEVSED